MRDGRGRTLAIAEGERHRTRDAVCATRIHEHRVSEDNSEVKPPHKICTMRTHPAAKKRGSGQPSCRRSSAFGLSAHRARISLVVSRGNAAHANGLAKLHSLFAKRRQRSDSRHADNAVVKASTRAPEVPMTMPLKAEPEPEAAT